MVVVVVLVGCSSGDGAAVAGFSADVVVVLDGIEYRDRDPEAQTETKTTTTTTQCGVVWCDVMMIRKKVDSEGPLRELSSRPRHPAARAISLAYHFCGDLLPCRDPGMISRHVQKRERGCGDQCDWCGAYLLCDCQ
jgi:hypothetical protein